MTGFYPPGASPSSAELARGYTQPVVRNYRAYTSALQHQCSSMRRRFSTAAACCVLPCTMGLQLTDTYHSMLKAVPRPSPLVSDLPMVYNSPLTDAHKALRPAAAKDVRTSCALFEGRATADEAPKRRACLASLWLAFGLLDECHALVGAESYSGSDAAYIHALLHRKEATFVGEFSMTGWANSKY